MRGPGMKSRPAVPRRIVSGLPTTSPLRQARRPTAGCLHGSMEIVTRSRVGQPEERLTTVPLYIAAGRRFFQFEMPAAITGVTKRTAANSGPVSPQPVNTGA